MKYCPSLSLGILLTLIFHCSNKSCETNIQYPPPESTIYKYWSLLAKRDYRNALFCFAGHRDEYFDSNLIFPISQGVESLKVDSILYKKFQKKFCIIYYRIKYYSSKGMKNKYFVTGDKMILTEEGWKIYEVLKFY